MFTTLLSALVLLQSMSPVLSYLLALCQPLLLIPVVPFGPVATLYLEHSQAEHDAEMARLNGEAEMIPSQRVQSA